MKRLMFTVGALSLAAWLAFSAAAQVTKGRTRPAQTTQLMKGLVKPAGTAIGKATRKPPTDDKGWTELATNAALLNEASFLLMDDGRCPDATWEEAAKALRSATEEMLAKIESKDIKGVERQVSKMNSACAACHNAHRK